MLVLVLSTFAGNAQTPVSTITTQEATTDEVKEQIEQCLVLCDNLTKELHDLITRAERLMQGEGRDGIFLNLNILKNILENWREELYGYHISGDYTGFAYEETRARLDEVAYLMNDLYSEVEAVKQESISIVDESLSQGNAIMSRIHEVEYKLDKIALSDVDKQVLLSKLDEVKAMLDRLFSVLVNAKDSEDFSAISAEETRHDLAVMETILADIEARLHNISRAEIEDCLTRCHNYMAQLDMLNSKINEALSNGNQAMNELVPVSEDTGYLLLKVEKNCNEMLNSYFDPITYEMVLNWLDAAAQKLDYIEARYVELLNSNTAAIEKYIADLKDLKVAVEDLYQKIETSVNVGNKPVETLLHDAAGIIDAIDTLIARLYYYISSGNNGEFSETETLDILNDLKTKYTVLCKMFSQCNDQFEYYQKLKSEIDLVKQTMSQVPAYNVSFPEVKSLINDVVAEFASALDIFADKVEKLFLSQALSSEEYKDCMAEIESLTGNSERLLMCVDYISYYNTAFDEYLTNIGKYCPDVKDRFIPEMEACMAEFISYVSKLLREVITDPDAAYNFISRIKDMVSDPYRIYQTAAKAQNEFTGVDGVVVADEADVDYYTLEGRKVANPAAGTVLIRVSSNGNIQKVFVK